MGPKLRPPAVAGQRSAEEPDIRTGRAELVSGELGSRGVVGHLQDGLRPLTHQEGRASERATAVRAGLLS